MDKAHVEKVLQWPEGGMSQLIWVIMQSIATGGTYEKLAQGFGTAVEELQKIVQEVNQLNDGAQLFEQGVAFLRIDAQGGILDRDYGWDDLERVVLAKLQKMIPKITDADVLLRIGTAANRAKRSTDVPEQAKNPKDSGRVTIDPVTGAVVLEGGNLGTLQLNLNQRIINQLADPDSSKTIEHLPATPEDRPIEMIRLSDMRNLVEHKEVKPESRTSESLAPEKKEKIHISEDMIDSFMKMTGMANA